MTSDVYWGEDATLEVKIGSTTYTVGKARNISVRAEADHVELYTPDSVKRDTVKRRQVAVLVDLEVVEWDEGFAQAWLGATEAGATCLTDTSDVAEYQVTTELDMTDHDETSGSESIKAVISNVHFSEIPLIEAAEGEYSSFDLAGRGDDVVFTNEVVA